MINCNISVCCVWLDTLYVLYYPKISILVHELNGRFINFVKLMYEMYIFVVWMIHIIEMVLCEKKCIHIIFPNNNFFKFS